MSASDRFSELRQRVEQGESNIKAAASEDSAKLKAKADEARKAADEHAAQFAATAQETSEQAESHWNELQSSWDQHVQHIRQRIAEKKAEHDVASAKRDAEWAESDAVNAVDFAMAAVEEAEYAVLDAAWPGRMRTLWPPPPSSTLGSAGRGLAGSAARRQCRPYGRWSPRRRPPNRTCDFHRIRLSMSTSSGARSRS
jgi:hypothetical protein